METKTARCVNSAWFHYVGHEHYLPKSFIAEAKKIGFVSRDISPHIAQNMEFGDRVICLDWRGEKIPPAAFCEFRVSRFFFDEEISEAVGEELIKEGRCHYDGSGAGSTIQRACGSWTSGGSYFVDESVNAKEIFERVEKAAEEKGIPFKSLFCMVGGPLIREYLPPVTVVPFQDFYQGFSHVPKGTRIGDEPIGDVEPSPAEIVVVNKYDKRHSNLQ